MALCALVILCVAFASLRVAAEGGELSEHDLLAYLLSGAKWQCETLETYQAAHSFVRTLKAKWDFIDGEEPIRRELADGEMGFTRYLQVVECREGWKFRRAATERYDRQGEHVENRQLSTWNTSEYGYYSRKRHQAVIGPLYSTDESVMTLGAFLAVDSWGIPLADHYFSHERCWEVVGRQKVAGNECYVVRCNESHKDVTVRSDFWIDLDHGCRVVQRREYWSSLTVDFRTFP